MDTITEQEFLDAIKIIREYKLQVERMTEQALRETAIIKTPAELESDWQKHFPTMSIRLWSVLISQFKDVRICEISFDKFLHTRNVGRRTLIEFCQLTGKGEAYLKRHEMH